MARVAAALLAFVLGALLLLAAPAAAQDTVVQEPPQTCPAASLGLPCVQDDLTGGLVGGARDALLEELCPAKKPPAPESPDRGVPWAKAGGSTTFQQFGYAGLQVTTYDQGCLAQINASTASQANEILNQVDALINSAQVSSLSSGVVSPIHDLLPDALDAIRDTFWTPWMPVAAAAVGLIILAGAILSRSAVLATFSLNLVLILAVVPWLLSNSDVVTDLGGAATTGVASQTAEGLMRLSPSQAGQSAAAAYGDAYYQIAWTAHEQLAFGSHERAAAKYAPQFVATKAFSYSEMDAMRGNPGLEQRLVEQKNARWLELAEQLREEHPAAFGTWSNPQGAWGTVLKHGAVSVFAGSWVFLLSIAVLALRFLLPFALLLVAGFGFLALVRHQLTTAFAGMLLTAIAGPPMIALVAGSLLFFFYVVMSDPGTAWWSAIVAGFAMGVAALLALKWLAAAVLGFGAVSMAQGATRRGRSAVRRGAHRRGAPGRSVAAGAAAGATAAAVVGSDDGPAVRTPGGGPDAPGRQLDPPIGPAASADVDRTERLADEPTVMASPSVPAPTSAMAVDWDSFDADGSVDEVAWGDAEVAGWRREPGSAVTVGPDGHTTAVEPSQAAHAQQMSRRLIAAHGGGALLEPAADAPVHLEPQDLRWADQPGVDG